LFGKWCRLSAAGLAALHTLSRSGLDAGELYPYRLNLTAPSVRQALRAYPLESIAVLDGKSSSKPGGAGEIRLGNHVRINTGAMLVAYSKICVDDDCLIGEYVSIRDADHATVPGTPIRHQGHVSSSVSVKKGAWIGRGCVILKGVTIGERAVIGANSVVTKDVPPNAIAVGAPARVIRFQTS